MSWRTFKNINFQIG